MLLGVHCSVSGGLENAFEEAKSLGIDTFQIFTRNQRQWVTKPISDEEQSLFSSKFKQSDIKTIFSHASYLINLGTPRDDLWENSTKAIKDEVKRSHALELSFTVLHPGSAKDTTEEIAIQRVAAALKKVLDDTADSDVKILLENTAGQGSTIGYKFEHLQQIMKIVNSDRIGTCFDTCHAFAAGFDIRTARGFEDTMAEFDKIIGLDKLHALHLNDSKGGLGSHLDRHEHIGKGNIGLEPFKVIMNKFPNIPKVLETPKEDDMDHINLTTLHNLMESV